MGNGPSLPNSSSLFLLSPQPNPSEPNPALLILHSRAYSHSASSLFLPLTIFSPRPLRPSSPRAAGLTLKIVAPLARRRPPTLTRHRAHRQHTTSPQDSFCHPSKEQSIQDSLCSRRNHSRCAQTAPGYHYHARILNAPRDGRCPHAREVITHRLFLVSIGGSICFFCFSSRSCCAHAVYARSVWLPPCLPVDALPACEKPTAQEVDRRGISL